MIGERLKIADHKSASGNQRIHHSFLNRLLSVLSFAMSERIRGSCLCGGVKFEVEPPLIQANHCHCVVAVNIPVHPSAHRRGCGDDSFTSYKAES